MRFRISFLFRLVGVEGEAKGIAGIVALTGIVALVIVVVALVAVR
jgi:hypothetical protein